MGALPDTSLLSSLVNCDDCRRIISRSESEWRLIGENLHVPICPHCHAQRMDALDRVIVVALARVIVADAHDLLNAGHSFAPPERISIFRKRAA